MRIRDPLLAVADLMFCVLLVAALTVPRRAAPGVAPPAATRPVVTRPAAAPPAAPPATPPAEARRIETGDIPEPPPPAKIRTLRGPRHDGEDGGELPPHAL